VNGTLNYVKLNYVKFPLVHNFSCSLILCKSTGLCDSCSRGHVIKTNIVVRHVDSTHDHLCLKREDTCVSGTGEAVIQGFRKELLVNWLL